jgi:uncharacterized protein YqgV (UPF0045/DUF77 family)
VKSRIWWKVVEEGLVLSEIRYNKMTLNIAGHGTTIEVKSLKKIMAVYRTIVKAINAGELDQSIENTVIKSRPSQS